MWWKVICVIFFHVWFYYTNCNMTIPTTRACFVFHHVKILLTLLCCVSGNKNLYLYQRTNDIFLQNTFTTLTSPTRVKCCAYCDQTDGCMSVSYQESSKTCKLSRDPLVSVFVNGQTDNSWKSYSKNGKFTDKDIML
jgi:hypothetical protein